MGGGTFGRVRSLSRQLTGHSERMSLAANQATARGAGVAVGMGFLACPAQDRSAMPT